MDTREAMRRTVPASLLALLLTCLSVPVFTAVAAAEGEAATKTPSYFELKPSIVANMQRGAKYIRCDVQLLTTSTADQESLTHHAAALRHEMFLLLSDQEGEQLKAAKGKEKFRKQALKAMRKVMQSLSGREVVDDLFFTSFYVQ